MSSRQTMNRRLIASAIAAFLISTTAISGCASASEITAVPSTSLVLDVRTPSEFADWHYPGAVNIPVQVLEKNLAKLGDKHRAIIVYCRSGNRSTAAKKILLENGFTNVKNGGGLSDMRKHVKN